MGEKLKTIGETNQSISEKVIVLGKNCESGINKKTQTVSLPAY